MLNSVIGTQQLLLASCSQDALAGLPKLMTFNMLRLKAIEPVASVAKTPVTSTSLEHTIITFGVREPSITIHLVTSQSFMLPALPTALMSNLEPKDSAIQSTTSQPRALVTPEVTRSETTSKTTVLAQPPAFGQPSLSLASIKEGAPALNLIVSSNKRQKQKENEAAEVEFPLDLSANGNITETVKVTDSEEKNVESDKCGDSNEVVNAEASHEVVVEYVPVYVPTLVEELKQLKESTESKGDSEKNGGNRKWQ